MLVPLLRTHDPWFLNKNFWEPFASRNFFVLVPPLRTHDSWFLDKIFTHEMKLLPKPYFSKAEIKKLWSNETNAFSMFIVTKRPSIFFLVL